MTAIQSRHARTFALVGLRRWGDNAGTPLQAVYDGDTVHVRPVDEEGRIESFAIMFLGIYTPETDETEHGFIAEENYLISGCTLTNNGVWT